MIPLDELIDHFDAEAKFLFEELSDASTNPQFLDDIADDYEIARDVLSYLRTLQAIQSGKAGPSRPHKSPSGASEP